MESGLLIKNHLESYATGTYLIIRYFTISISQHNKQTLHVFLFNIRNYSPEVMNIVLPRVNNFDIKQKKGMKFLFFYMPPTPNKIWGGKG